MEMKKMSLVYLHKVNQRKHPRPFLCRLKILPVLFLLASWHSSLAQTCATSERTQNINFFNGSAAGIITAVAGLNINGWLGAGAGSVSRYNNRTYLSDNTNPQSFAQSITAANLKGNGATFTLVFNSFNGVENEVLNGDRANLIISYSGITYATISTTDGGGTTGTISFSNGATGSINGGAITGSILNFQISNESAVVTHALLINMPPNIANSGTLQMQFQPVSGGPSSASDDYDILTASLKACPIIYSGTIFDDGNGLTDGAINGTATNLGLLQVALYDGSGNIVPGTTTNVNTNGTYSIAYAGSGNYSVGIVNLPTNYVYIGEKRNTDIISDGIVNGKAGPITITNTTTNTDHPNNLLGINARPETYAVTSSVTGTPKAVSFATLNPLQASDIEQQPTQGNWSGTGESIQITTLPTNSFELVYNNVVVTAGQIITSYDPALMVIRPTGTTPVGTSSTSFTYAAIDLNGTPDLTSAAYTVTFSQSLPVLFGKISAWIGNGVLDVQWTTLSEKNNDFFILEASNDGLNFLKIAEVKSKAANGNSDEPIQYKWTNPVSGIGLGIGIGLLLLGSARLKVNSRKRTWLICLVSGLCICIAGCQKDNGIYPNPNGNDMFIRLAQVDKDGTKKYSGTIKVIQ